MMDGFASTLPFALNSPDKIVSGLNRSEMSSQILVQHYKDTPAQEAWLMQLMHHLDLCEEQDS